MQKIKYIIVVFATFFVFSCTTLGKPIESCFNSLDNIQYYNCIGIVKYGLPNWEYRICQSNTDKTDICIDGTLKNFFNKTIVDLTFDDITIKGTIEYKYNIIGEEIIINLNDGKISGTVFANGDDERWDLMIYDKQLNGTKHTVRFDSTLKLKYGEEEITAKTDDIFMGINLYMNFGNRLLKGKIKNIINQTKYLFNSDDLSESDMMAFTIIDIIRILRSMENNRR